MNAVHVASELAHSRRGAAADDHGRIEFSADDLERLELFWTSRWRRQPTPAEVRALLEEEVREEILYREALTLGLDRDDMVVKRYLAQKLGMVIAELATVRDPDRTDIVAWFVHHSDRFKLPPHASFRHRYFSIDERHDRARSDAETALAELRCSTAEAERCGDSFPFQDYFGHRTPEEVAQVFGNGFAETLFQLPPATWLGPIESAFGWHLVWIDSLDPGRVPALDEVEAAARAEWLSEQRTEAKRAFYESVRGRYAVVVGEEPVTEGAIS
jgi:peptidyl-prolyl cis-trans isomerase C